MHEGGLVAPPALVWRMGCAWHQCFAFIGRELGWQLCILTITPGARSARVRMLHYDPLSTAFCFSIGDRRFACIACMLVHVIKRGAEENMNFILHIYT